MDLLCIYHRGRAMPMRGMKAFLGSLAGVLAMAAGSGEALADVKQQCADAYVQTQTARKASKLRGAREQVLLCAQNACPDVVKKECAVWLTEIDASLPTVVFEARDSSGSETSAVRVLFDGEVLKEQLDGKAVTVDPGEHRVRYELEGQAPIEELVVIREGEKNRKLSITFLKAAPVTPPPGSDTSAGGLGGVPTITYVLGGVGVVGIGLFATFGILGTSDKSELEDTCAPSCSEADVDGVRAKLIAADVSLGVGVVALGVAAFLFFTAPPATAAPAPATALRFDWQPTQGGFVTTFGGRF